MGIETAASYNVQQGRYKGSLQNAAFEPKLTDFAIKSWDGDVKCSNDFHKGCNIVEHREPIIDLLATLKTDIIKGLTDDQVAKNRELFGENILQRPKKKSELAKFIACTLGGLNSLILACGFASLASYMMQIVLHTDADIENLYGGIALTIVVLIAGCFTYYQEYQSAQILESFTTLLPQNVTVVRNGSLRVIDAASIVVGDMIEISYGDKIPADIRILECESLKVDNSSLTGECEPQLRSNECTHTDPLETRNLLFFSTIACQGRGKGVVIRVGSNTVMGRLASIASSTKPCKTPLAKEMSRCIYILSTVSVVFGVFFFVVGKLLHYSWLSSLFFSTGIVVANVPENLQVTLTIMLTLGAKRMSEKNCIVRHLHAVETLGCASVICSDKTGTLTQNKMSVSHVWCGGRINSVIATANKNNCESNECGDLPFSWKEFGFQDLARAAMLCGTARFTQQKHENPSIFSREAKGDATEVAILKCMEANFGNVEVYRSRHPRVYEIPFNSANKFHLCIHDIKDPNDQRLLAVVKGAPERILAMCTSILAGFEEHELTDERRDEVNSVYAHLGGKGERVLGFCDYRIPLDTQLKRASPILPETGFRFLGLISLVDPPRTCVPDAVMKCKEAGIQVVMVTGDHPITATAIAKTVGIISSDFTGESMTLFDKDVSFESVNCSTAKSAVITGASLVNLSDDELTQILKMFKEIVFARTSPEQKFRIVEAFQQLGHVVAVTGDGINDSPALKKANVGIAMGSGTDVSKEVADLILLDDDFTSIVAGIEHGRLLFDNLKKLMRYLMADNVAEMYCYLVFITLRITPPMGTLAMLVSTLCIDVFPAVSLAHESPESDIMKLKPRNPHVDTLITPQMLSYSYGQVSIIETAAGFFAYFVTFGLNGWLPDRLINCQARFDSKAVQDLEDSYRQEWGYHQRQCVERQAQTAFFLGIVLCQFINAIVCKTRRLSVFQQGMRNRLMNQNLLLMLTVACVVIYTPGLNTALSFVPLRFETWLAVIPFCLLLFTYDEMRRLVVRTGKGSWLSKELQT